MHSLAGVLTGQSNIEKVIEQSKDMHTYLVAESEDLSMATRKKARVEVGRDINGKPTYKWVGGSTTKELHDAIVRVYIESGLIETLVGATFAEDEKPKEKSIKFKKYVSQWIEVYKAPKLKPTTLKNYRSVLNKHLYPAFGKYEMNDVTTDDVQLWLNKNADLANKTLKEILGLMSMIYEDAIEDGEATKNPTKSRKLVIPSTKKTEREALTLDQFKAINDNLAVLPLEERRMMALLMYTGMRRGEVLGLMWEDIDPTTNEIHVRRNVTYTTNQPHIGTTKTEAGCRVIPLIPILWELLEYHGETGYIFGGEKPFTRMNYNRRWYHIKKNLDLFGATAHVFRHTFLTLLSNAGVQPKIIQVIAGHADIAVTMNRYTHGQHSEILNAGKAFVSLFDDSDIA